MKTKTSCAHPFVDHNHHNSFTTCFSCGLTIFIQSNKKSYCTLKPSNYNGKTELNSLSTFPIIKNTFSPIELQTEPPSEWYMKNRQRAIKHLQEYSQIYHYSELTYYLSLTLIDEVMKKVNKMSMKKLEIYVITCLVIAAKFKESNIIEPNLSRFTSSGDYYDIDEMDIVLAEVEILKILKYKLNFISAYEILKIFFYDGFVYSCELKNKPKDFITIVYCYAKKILSDIVHNDNSIIYNPLQIAFSVIHLTRKNFNFEKNFFNLIKKFYDIHLNEYKDCLNICKKIITNPSTDDRTISYKQVSQSSRILSSMYKKENSCTKETKLIPKTSSEEKERKRKRREKKRAMSVNNINNVVMKIKCKLELDIDTSYIKSVNIECNDKKNINTICIDNIKETNDVRRSRSSMIIQPITRI